MIEKKLMPTARLERVLARAQIIATERGDTWLGVEHFIGALSVEERAPVLPDDLYDLRRVEFFDARDASKEVEWPR